MRASQARSHAGRMVTTSTRARSSRSALAAAAAVLIIAVPVATWWLIGQQNADGLPSSDLDYAVRPLSIGSGQETELGAVALLLTAVATAVLLHATRRQRFDPRWWQAILPLLVAGLLLGVGWRILTAGVIGANIGAAFTVFFAGPVFAALVVGAVVRGLLLRFAGGTG